MPVLRASRLGFVLLLISCAEDRAVVAFSERPELRAEPVTGCGGGALRYLVPELAMPALQEAALAQLASEPPWELESARIPCEICGLHGEVCGYVVIRYRDVQEGRAGLRLRFQSTVVNASRSWQVLDSERVLDEARLFGSLSFEDARALLEWSRARRKSAGPVDAITGIEGHTDATAPRGAMWRIASVVRVEERAVVFRYLYVKREAGAFVVVDERQERVEGWFPPPVRGTDEGALPAEEMSGW